MAQFEYKVFTYNNWEGRNPTDTSLEASLNELGSQGWELVSSIPVVDGRGSDGDMAVDTDEIKFIFKKEK